MDFLHGHIELELVGREFCGVGGKFGQSVDDDVIRMRMMSQFREIIEDFVLVVKPVRSEIAAISVGAIDISSLKCRKSDENVLYILLISTVRLKHEKYFTCTPQLRAKPTAVYESTAIKYLTWRGRNILALKKPGWKSNPGKNCRGSSMRRGIH